MAGRPKRRAHRALMNAGSRSSRGDREVLLEAYADGTLRLLQQHSSVPKRAQAMLLVEALERLNLLLRYGFIEYQGNDLQDLRDRITARLQEQQH